MTLQAAPSPFNGFGAVFRTNRHPVSTNCKNGAKPFLFVQLGDREDRLFQLSKAPTRLPDLGFPLLPHPDCQAPSFKSVTNADLEPPFHRPWNGGLICPAVVFCRRRGRRHQPAIALRTTPCAD